MNGKGSAHAGRQHIYLALRWVPLLWGALTLGLVLARQGASLPWGDVLLLGALSSALRQRTVVMRRGGDEFLILLDGLGREDAGKVMHRLQRSIEDTLAVHPQFAGLAGVSAGLAVYPHDAYTHSALVELADGWMYADKMRRKAQQAPAATMANA